MKPRTRTRHTLWVVISADRQFLAEVVFARRCAIEFRDARHPSYLVIPYSALWSPQSKPRKAARRKA